MMKMINGKSKIRISEMGVSHSRQQSLGEEIANSITHGIGAALSIVALVLLVVFASIHGDTWRVVSLSIYGATLFFLYSASTLYHSFTNRRVKRFFGTVSLTVAVFSL